MAMRLKTGILVLALAALPLAPTEDGAATGEPPPAAPAATAAAPGYVKDASCAVCHSDFYQPYQEVGMARSFYRPGPDKVIEDFDDNHYFHEPSQRHYEMSRRDGRLLFKRYQLDPDGEPINVFEQGVDWILGSGNHSRTYLFATPGGELYQLPVAWYTQTSSWGMAPGFDRPDHLGLMRRVRRECMFCHNAYPEMPAASDSHWQPHVYPRELPQGTGCQRCHGPGAEHVRAATEEMENKLWVRASIVNPARLAPQRRDDVCDQCHLQPSVALSRVRRFGRGDYSFRPGRSLADDMVVFDVVEEGVERPDRFEINHHPYRLRQSRCFAESGRDLHCLTCHDPHRKVAAEERAAHYRAACLTCHTVDACSLAAMGESAGGPAVDPGDCVTCHMAKRRTRDVVRVVMTDHLIRRVPGGEELLAPIEESEPVLVDVEPLDPERAPQGQLGEIHRAVVVLRAGGNVAAVEHLEKMLAAVEPPELEPYLDLARGQLHGGLFAAAERTLLGILERAPDLPQAREWLALAYKGLGRPDEAVKVLRGVVEENPERTEAWFNLGLILTGSGEYEEALEALERAIELRPNLAPAWFYQGLARDALGRSTAAASYRRALEIDPTHGRAYLLLGETLLSQGKKAEALRYWRHGVTAAKRPEPIAEALAKATSGP